MNKTVTAIQFKYIIKPYVAKKERWAFVSGYERGYLEAKQGLPQRYCTNVEQERQWKSRASL